MPARARPTAPRAAPPATILRFPSRKYPPGVAFEYFLFVRSAERAVLNIALRIVVMMPAFRVDAAHRADHLGGEQDVLRRDHLEQQVDSRLVVDAGVEKDILQQVLFQRRALHVLREAAVAAPVVGHGAAAVRDDQPELREVLEEIAADELHEGGGVGVDVVRAGEVERRVARLAHVHHRRHVELDHALEHRVPPAIGERRLLPPAARGIRIEVAADEAELPHAALELADAVLRLHAWRLRQLAHRREVLRIQPADAVDQIVAHARPLLARFRVADVVLHAARARREERDIGAALALQLELRSLDALADLVLRDLRLAGRPRELRLAPGGEAGGRGGVMAVAINDHARLSFPRDLALPQLPRADVVAPRLDLAALFRIQVSHRRAERDGLRLQPGADLEVHGAADHVLERWTDDRDAVPAHQDGRLLAQALHQRAAEGRVVHQHLGHAEHLARLPHRHRLGEEAAGM